MDSNIIIISDSEGIVVETIDLTSDNDAFNMLGLNRHSQQPETGHRHRHGGEMEEFQMEVCKVDTKRARVSLSRHNKVHIARSSPSTPYDCDPNCTSFDVDRPFESMLPGSQTQSTPVSATKTLECTRSKEYVLDAAEYYIDRKNGEHPRKENRKKMRRVGVKTKEQYRRHSSSWHNSTLSVLSSDSDFDEETTPKKPSFVRRHIRSPKGKPAAMVSLSRPVNNFPSSLCSPLKPKLTNLHLKHGYTSDEFSTDSDLQDVFGSVQRAASPMLVELYPSIKAEKQPIKRQDDQSFLRTPVKKIKLEVNHQHSLDKCSPTDLPKTVTKETTTLKNIRKTLLNLSDFSDSDGDFEALDKQIMRTPSKQSWLKRTSPSKCKGSGLPRLFRKEERPVGVPIHIQVKESNYKIQNSEQPDGKDSKNQTGVSEPSYVLKFCQRQRDLVEAVMEEDFNDEAISFIRDFTTLHRGAPEEYMMYLLKDVMLADNMETSTILNAYGALMHIQRIHPASAATLSLDWDLVTSVIKRLSLETETLDSPRPAHILVFQFIVVVLMEDFQTMQINNTPIMSFAHDLLSTDRYLSHVRDIIQWICQIIKNKFKRKTPSASPPPQMKPDQAKERNIFTFLQQFTEPSESTRPATASPRMGAAQTVGCGSYYTVLQLLQKLLVLSFAEGRNISALKIAEEFLYPYLYIPSLDQRKLCLQTLTCDPVRAKVIELLLENLCDPSAREEQQGVLTVRKIVECHFRSRPMRVSEFVEVEADMTEGGAVGKKMVREERMAECEELAMLLFFLLQSYIRTKRVKYHLTSSQHLPSHGSQNTSNSQNCQPSESSSGEQHWLSADDRECLWQLGDHVEALGGHLRCHCDRLTLRTKLYLAQIECLREMAV